MGWDRAFAAAATYAKPEQFETFRRHIDAAWIEQALAATGTATVRRRRLPVERSYGSLSAWRCAKILAALRRTRAPPAAA